MFGCKQASYCNTKEHDIHRLKSITQAKPIIIYIYIFRQRAPIDIHLRSICRNTEDRTSQLVPLCVPSNTSEGSKPMIV